MGVVLVKTIRPRRSKFTRTKNTFPSIEESIPLTSGHLQRSSRIDISAFRHQPPTVISSGPLERERRGNGRVRCLAVSRHSFILSHAMSTRTKHLRLESGRLALTRTYERPRKKIVLMTRNQEFQASVHLRHLWLPLLCLQAPFVQMSLVDLRNA